MPKYCWKFVISLDVKNMYKRNLFETWANYPKWTYVCRKAQSIGTKANPPKCFSERCVYCLRPKLTSANQIDTFFSRLSELGWKKDWLCTRRRRQMFIYSQGGAHSLRRWFNMLVCLCAHSTLNGSLSALAFAIWGCSITGPAGWATIVMLINFGRRSPLLLW